MFQFILITMTEEKYQDALEDPKWSLGDLRSLLPADSTWNDTQT